jgi:hypothetical protein
MDALHLLSGGALRALCPWLGVIIAAGSAHLPAQELLPLPEDLEIGLARSALPAHLRDGATIYVLRPETGFVAVKQGDNGFHAFVVRNDPAFVEGTWPYDFYRNDVLVPIAFDPVGAKAQMRVLFDVAAARASGMPASDLKDTLKGRFASGYYRAPERGGIAFMLSPILRAYRDASSGDEVGTFMYPHYMVYAPGVTNEDVGGAPGSGHPFILEPGVHGYLIIPTGSAEAEAIASEHAGLLARACQLNEAWCLSRRD